MSVSWEALTEDIQRAHPGSTLYYELIRTAHRYIEEQAMAKGPKAPAGTGKVPSKNGARHDANVIKVSNRWGRTGIESTGKHAKPPKGGGKK